MNKKFIALLLTLMLVFSCVIILTACDSQNGLAYGKKYVWEGAINKEDPETYYCYVFNADGTGTYYYYKSKHKTYDDNLSMAIYDWHFNFKYTFADDDKSAVICFYDGDFVNKSLKFDYLGWNKETYEDIYSEEATAYDITVDTTWSRIITVSQNVLAETLSTSIRKYVNEDYAKTLTNFNKDAND